MRANFSQRDPVLARRSTISIEPAVGMTVKAAVLAFGPLGKARGKVVMVGSYGSRQDRRAQVAIIACYPESCNNSGQNRCYEQDQKNSEQSLAPPGGRQTPDWTRRIHRRSSSLIVFPGRRDSVLVIRSKREPIVLRLPNSGRYNLRPAPSPTTATSPRAPNNADRGPRRTVSVATFSVGSQGAVILE